MLPDGFGKRGNLASLDLELISQGRKLALGRLQLHRLRTQLALPLFETPAFAVQPREPLPVRRGEPCCLVLAHGELGMTGLKCLTPLLDGGAKVGEPRLLGLDSGDPLGKLLLALRQCSRTGRDRARQVLVEPLLLRHTTIVKRSSGNVAVTSGAPKRH